MGQHPADGGALPTECWEDIILRLPPSEIPSMRLVNRPFRELIDNSPEIKYRLDLFSAGLEERDAGDSLSIQDRQQKLETYCSRWESFDHTKLTPLAFPDNQDPCIYKGFLISCENADGFENIHFILLPSPTMGLLRKEWTIQIPLSGVSCGLDFHPPLDLLAISVVSREENSFEIQMFHMSDGSPYPNCGVMGFNYGSLMQFGLISLQLTECRISALVFPRAIPKRRKVYDLFIWDWRTGKKYLERSQMTTSACFIDEYRLLGTVYRNYETFLMLWDASNDTSNGSTCPLGLVLDTKPWDVGFPVLSVPEYNMNHELPFRENRSMGVVLFKICGPSYKPFTEIYAIPVGTLAKFPPVGRLGWWEWRRFATLTEISPPSPSSISHILHSRALNFHVPRNSSEVILKVHDFSLRSRRQKAREDPSAPFPSYTVQEFPLDPKYNADSLEFMDSGIFAALPDPWGRAGERYFLAI